MINNNLKNNLIVLQKEYFSAKSDNIAAEMVEHIAGKNVLKENLFKVEEKYIKHVGEFLKDHKYSYMLDEEMFAKYSELHHKAMKSLGLDVPLEKTATYLTFKKLKKAEDNLLDFGKQISQEKLNLSNKTYEELHSHYKFRDVLLDLLLRLKLD